MLITFSGLDGAGKSTLIRWLRATLERERRPVTVLRFNDDVTTYALARRLRDRLLGRRPVKGPPRHEPSPTRLGRVRDALVWNKALRQWLYPLDLLLFLGFRLWLERRGDRIVIMDRYFYDTLVDVAGAGEGRWLRLLARLTPTPDLPVLLAISPEEAFARKGEYTLPYLQDRAAAYDRVGPWVARLVRLSATELDAAKPTLERLVRDRMAS